MSEIKQNAGQSVTRHERITWRSREPENGGSKPPLMLLHPLPHSGSIFSTIAPLLACLLLLIPAALQAEQKLQGSLSQQPMQGKNMRIKRSTLLVHDLHRSIAFYRDVVGLELYDVEEEYNTDPDSYGYPLFNIPMGARKRMALFNTSDEVRGFAIEEVLDFEWEVQQKPRAATVLFETDDIAGLEQRLRDGGFTVFEPARGSAYNTHFVELGFLDPDGHLLSAYQYFPEGQ